MGCMNCVPAAQGGVVALWMTNRDRLWRFVERELLPHWGLEIAATWAWMKVSSSGQLLGRLVCPAAVASLPTSLQAADAGGHGTAAGVSVAACQTSG